MVGSIPTCSRQKDIPRGARRLAGKPVAKRLQGYFLTGLLTVLPAAITLYVVYLLFSFLTRITGLVFPTPIPGLGLVLALVVLVILGAVVEAYFGRRALEAVEHLLSRTPVVRGIYDASKQMVSLFFDPKRSGFHRVVLVTMAPGVQTVGFVLREDEFGDGRKAGVLVPLSPPTSSMFLLVDPAALEPLAIPADEAMKLIISAGTLAPRWHRPAKGE